MSLFHDSTIVQQPKCHGKSKSGNKPGPSSTSSNRQHHFLPRLISIPSLSSVVRNSFTWAGDTLYSYRDWASKEQRKALTEAEDRKEVLYLRMRNVNQGFNIFLALVNVCANPVSLDIQAVSVEEWKSCACELDELEDNNTWKRTFECSEYNPLLVQERLKQLEEARVSCDVSRMLFLIRTSLSRDLGNMSNVSLYRHSHVGTKELIDRYITTALDTISTLVELSGNKCDGLELRYMLDQLLAARQAFGRSALLFSGGATFGMNHIGVLKVLWQAKLLPRIISGASAGSIICAVFCTRTDDELLELLDTYAYGDFAVFDEEGKEENILQKTARFLKYGSFLDISHLAKVMRNWLGDITFQEAYNRTRRILNICVSSAGMYELPRLLNYITAPNVMIWSAVAVSCSVPLVFTPFALMAKDPLTGEAVPWNDFDTQYIDGSVDGDLPMTRLSEMFNVNHFIVSQVNPHVVPFLPRDDGPSRGRAEESPVPRWLRAVTHLAKDEILHRMTVLSDLGIFPTSLSKAASIMNQKYYGDINIYPKILYSNFPRILKNPTTEFMLQACLSGERATWPKLGRIRNHCAIELALDSAIQKMRARVTFSPSPVDLRQRGLNDQSVGSLDSSSGRGRMLNRRSSYDQGLTLAARTRPGLDRRSMVEVRRTRSVLFSEQTPSTKHALHAATVGQQLQGLADNRQCDGPYLVDSEYGETDLSSPERPVLSRGASWGSSPYDQQAQWNGSQSSPRIRPSSSAAVSVPNIPASPKHWPSSVHSGDETVSQVSFLNSKTVSPPHSLLQMIPTIQVGSPGTSTRHSYG
ncbi:putative Patatin family phospholipase [Aspergillus clavatus NRRL 1]|uniref:Patatin-like phospholipase domain-containing protein n=1 Tax=Aspergillus clavatus (strain ATCC 1007 / CBS 513.65 / DSM 816 / NCTC 3887 / NRRL 1 / QM 1276 / 107) TaxID=344612 RepID=A1CHF7_ASPCL|nr:Patatin family phospholipase, putative [Aspergillus clavatus NRRL 1]EAW10312.1 Patatin family phospholipase, putative [Aspergillus clavatus NRRL 1]